MERMKSKVQGLFSAPNKDPVGGGGARMNPEEWEIRPGGMLVQKRELGLNQTSVPVSTIRVRVKYGSVYHEIRISSQASFGELKKLLAEYTGLHPQDQKLLYKKKEKDSKTFLDVERVKDGSKLVLVEDISSRTRRCLEMLKNANLEKASKSISQISLDIDKFAEQVTALQAAADKGGRVATTDVDTLTGALMERLVKLDEFSVNGDLNLQKRILERRMQKLIETLDVLKLDNSLPRSNGEKILLKQKQQSMRKEAIVSGKQQMQGKQCNFTEQKPVIKQSIMQPEAIIFTTTWETFD